MNDEQELVIAKWLLELARDCAGVTCNPQDVEAATAAILIRALQPCHPGKTNAGLARLLFVDGKDGQQEYDNFVSTLSAEQRARLFQGEE